MSDNPEALARAAQETRQRQLGEIRAEHDKRIAAHRESMAEIERRAAASVPTPTQEEADLARLGLIGPDGFASSREAPPGQPQERAVPRVNAPAPRPETPARARD